MEQDLSSVQGSSIGTRTYVADMAFIREKCQISSDVLIGKGVTIENNTIGSFTKVQTEAYITAFVYP